MASVYWLLSFIFLHSTLTTLSSKSHWYKVFTQVFVLNKVQISIFLANKKLIVLHDLQDCAQNLPGIGKSHAIKTHKPLLPSSVLWLKEGLSCCPVTSPRYIRPLFHPLLAQSSLDLLTFCVVALAVASEQFGARRISSKQTHAGVTQESLCVCYCHLVVISVFLSTLKSQEPLMKCH